ncbi:hypothetical protein ACSCBZ_02590 [Streptomyces niveiscabiei]|nr:hypothetical protein [Streptomyces niveiscabiei]
MPAFVRCLLDVDRYHRIDPDVLEYLEPEDLEELLAAARSVPYGRPSNPF